MEIKLKRRFKGTNYTIGSLFINNVYECDTIEDTDRGLSNEMPLSVIQTKKGVWENRYSYGNLCN